MTKLDLKTFSSIDARKYSTSASHLLFTRFAYLFTAANQEIRDYSGKKARQYLVSQEAAVSQDTFRSKYCSFRARGEKKFSESKRRKKREEKISKREETRGTLFVVLHEPQVKLNNRERCSRNELLLNIPYARCGRIKGTKIFQSRQIFECPNYFLYSKPYLKNSRLCITRNDELRNSRI